MKTPSLDTLVVHRQGERGSAGQPGVNGAKGETVSNHSVNFITFKQLQFWHFLPIKNILYVVGKEPNASIPVCFQLTLNMLFFHLFDFLYTVH